MQIIFGRRPVDEMILIYWTGEYRESLTEKQLCTTPKKQKLLAPIFTIDWMYSLMRNTKIIVILKYSYSQRTNKNYGIMYLYSQLPNTNTEVFEVFFMIYFVFRCLFYIENEYISTNTVFVFITAFVIEY